MLHAREADANLNAPLIQPHRATYPTAVHSPLPVVRPQGRARLEEAEAATRTAEERARVAENRAEAAQAALRSLAAARTEAETTAATQRRRADDAEQRARQLHERLEEHLSSFDDISHHAKKASVCFSRSNAGVSIMEKHPNSGGDILTLASIRGLGLRGGSRLTPRQ